MNHLNPDAIVAWLFFMSVGYALGGLTGMAVGLAMITGFQMFVAISEARAARKARG